VKAEASRTLYQTAFTASLINFPAGFKAFECSRSGKSSGLMNHKHSAKKKARARFSYAG